MIKTQSPNFIVYKTIWVSKIPSPLSPLLKHDVVDTGVDLFWTSDRYSELSTPNLSRPPKEWVYRPWPLPIGKVQRTDGVSVREITKEFRDFTDFSLTRRMYRRVPRFVHTRYEPYFRYCVTENTGSESSDFRVY